MPTIVATSRMCQLGDNFSYTFNTVSPVVLNLFHCWDPLNATDVVWDTQVKIEKVCAPE